MITIWFYLPYGYHAHVDVPDIAGAQWLWDRLYNSGVDMISKRP